ncbi:hypothetical protein DY000_02029077 [Brassica cretica]|uniref:Neprosin PEP catalytic domain-containing protein n=1 Tax=Brassica cretica TaxID=69181 RepID=A0ABQ7DJS6_BRACR|nr:hypothetical protein DY000_02029077 [Brassica cretica]
MDKGAILGVATGDPTTAGHQKQATKIRPRKRVGFFGNWALTVDDEIIGYWPGELFTHLNKGASRVRFGGNTFISPDGISPPMGNGYFPMMTIQDRDYTNETGKSFSFGGPGGSCGV